MCKELNMQTFYYDVIDPRSFETVTRIVKANSLRMAESIAQKRCRTMRRESENG